MQPTRTLSYLVTTLAVLTGSPAFSDTLSSDSSTTWECPQAGGTSMYTNKEKPGCQAMALKPLSVVPNLETMPTTSRTQPIGEPRYEIPAYQERTAEAGGRHVPDWARDWYANSTSSGSVQAEVCTLYMEWIHLVQKTRGGMFFGSDPSYGGDVTGRTQRVPSHSFYDNARYIALSRLFGTGFVPIGCF